jgi:AraC-like DNA-binding protein
VEEATIFRVDELGELEAMSASYNRYCFAEHWHPELFIAVTDYGHAKFRYRGGFHTAARGAVFVHHPGEPHSGGPIGSEGWTYRSIYVPETLFKRLTTSTSVPFFGDDVIDDSILAGIFRRFHQSLQTRSSRLRRESYLIGVLAWLRRYHSQPRVAHATRREPISVRRAKEFLHANLAEDVSASALARAAGLSPYHLIRVFHRDIGLTPHAYQLSIRVRRAKDLLRAGISVADVALQTGFYDQPHFTKVFKSHVGVTPGKYIGP